MNCIRLKKAICFGINFWNIHSNRINRFIINQKVWIENRYISGLVEAFTIGEFGVSHYSI
jgi:hypothetical protein